MKPTCAISQHQRIAVPAGRCGLNRRRFVDHAHVVEQHQRPGFGEREAFTVGATGIEDATLAAFHMFACYQQDGHKIHAIAVCALGCGAADAVGGVDAELVCFDIPGLMAFHLGTNLADGL